MRWAPVNLRRSIVMSSNVYYYSLAHEMGVQAIHDFMKPLGFGQITGIDMLGEVCGVLPSPEWKRKTYKRPEQQKWLPGETVSLGIGQGYNNSPPMPGDGACAGYPGLRRCPHRATAGVAPAGSVDPGAGNAVTGSACQSGVSGEKC